MIPRIGALVWFVTVAACGSGSKPREAYAVGAYVGVGSVFGPGAKCTYDVKPPTAAELDPDNTVGKLVAPGEMTMKCESGTTLTYDIVAPTSARITGDGAAVKVGAKADFAAYPYAGNRELKTDGHFTVDWSFGPDCGSSATTEVDLPAGGDSLKGSYHLNVVGKARGSCTLTAAVLGQTATKKLAIE